MEQPLDTNIPKPAKSFKLKVNGETKEIAMSYGLFNEVMKAIPNPQAIDQLLVSDPYLRDYIIRRVLTDKRKIESEDDLIDPFDLDIDLDVLDDLLGWVADHIMGFWLRSGKQTAAILERYRPTVTQLNQSVTGSVD